MNFAFVNFVDEKKNGMNRMPESFFYTAPNGLDSYLEIVFPTSMEVKKAQVHIDILRGDFVIAFAFGNKMHELWCRQVLKVPYLHDKKKARDYVKVLQALPKGEWESLRKISMNADAANKEVRVASKKMQDTLSLFRKELLQEGASDED